MRALVLTDVRQVTVQEAPDPAPGPAQAVLKVAAAGICGSDMAGFLGHSARRRPPLILGHEAIGTVVHVPPGDWPCRAGDRAVVNPLQSCGTCEYCMSGHANLCPTWRLPGMDREEGTFAEYVAVDARNVFPLESEMPDAQAAAMEPLANGVHLFGLVGQRCFGTLAIYGAGTQGILLLQLARLLGYRDIAVVDPNQARLRVATSLGAPLALDPAAAEPHTAIVEWTGGRGVDVGIDAAGTHATRQSVLQAVRPGGEVLLLGLHDPVTELDFPGIVRGERRLQGTFAYTPADFATSRRILQRGDVTLAPWTRERPLEEGQAAFDLLTTDPGDALKVLLRP